VAAVSTRSDDVPVARAAGSGGDEDCRQDAERACQPGDRNRSRLLESGHWIPLADGDLENLDEGFTNSVRRIEKSVENVKGDLSRDGAADKAPPES
jgi:hypothetical protein